MCGKKLMIASDSPLKYNLNRIKTREKIDFLVSVTGLDFLKATLRGNFILSRKSTKSIKILVETFKFIMLELQKSDLKPR